MPTEFDLGRQYDREVCLATIETDILRESRNSGEVVTVFFGGPSAGGKSSTACEIAGDKSQFSVLHMDDYMSGEILPFKSPPHPERPFLAGINPEVFDLGRIENDIIKLLSGRTVDKPEFDRKTHKRSEISTTFPPNRVLLIEGLYALTEDFLRHGNFGVYVDAPLHDRFIRKLIRGIEKYYYSDINKTIYSYLELVEPNFQIYADHLKSNAKYVLNNPGIGNTSLFCQETNLGVCTEGFELIPLQGNGSIQNGELLSVLKRSGIYYLEFFQRGNIVFSKEINQQTINTLSKYYNFRSMSEHEA